MNGTSRPAFAVADLTGWKGYFRLDWRSEIFPVRTSRDGPVVIFKSQHEAECQAWRVRDKIERPVMRRDGETITTARAAANALFKPKEAAHG